ncbi:hypothetical protein Neosp_013991 [[Neocosmospora] mangrovei]
MTMLSDPFRVIDDHASTITPPVPRPQKPVRLRLACDACTTAKECFYSASRRHGKRSRHRKAESDAQRSSSSEVPTPGAIPVPSGMKGMSYGSEFSWEERETSPQLSSYQASTLGNEQPTNATSTPPIEPHDPKQAHDCEALALGVLRSLHHHNADGICKAPAAANGGMNLAKPMPSIDTVLFANKAALTNLIPLLKCPCARNPHIALLHSTILSKTIFWYRVAVTARYHAEGAELRPMKIQLGMLDLDDDDQATLQRAVLLRELRKAEKVMETFDECSASEEEVPEWHATAIQNMKEELQEIIQKIKKGQGEWA